jgi:hypothetical protein
VGAGISLLAIPAAFLVKGGPAGHGGPDGSADEAADEPVSATL